MSSVQAIILKIDHSVEEIRSRSLDSIVKKLAHGILKETDLLENNQLMVNLIKWFGHETVPKRKEALKLILRLCQKSSKGIEQFVEADGMNVILRMRTESDRHSLKIIDELLDFLEQHHVDCGDAYSKTNSNISNSEKVEEILENNCEEEPNIQIMNNSNREYSGFKVISLPWINVHSIDLQILHSTNISLKSDDVQVINKAIDFLMDVVFKDFLPEIFLQYSQLLKNLIAITNRNHTHAHSLPQKASRCLQMFMKLLRNRINNKKDAAFFSLKQDVSAEAENNSNRNGNNIGDFLTNDLPINKLRSRGDGQDGNSRDRSNGSNSDKIEFIEGDHSNEISIPQFCVYLINNTRQLQQSNILGVLSVMLELLYTAYDLLSTCFTNHIWNDSSLIGRALVKQLKILFKTLANSILYHHNQLKRTENNLNVHWVVFCGLLDVGIKILKTTTTVETFVNLGLPERFIKCLLIANLNYPIYRHKPRLHENVRCYLLASNNSDVKTIYLEAITLQSSLKSASEFAEMEYDEATKSLIERAEIAMKGLHYFRNFGFEDIFVNYFSNNFDSFEENETENGFRILVTLFKHHDVDVKKQIYSKFLAIVQDYVSDCDNEDRLREVERNSRLLLNIEILRCIVENGFDDKSDEIKGLARKIITVLIVHFNKMTEDARKEFSNAILTFLPILLAYCDASTNLGRLIFNLFDNNGCWSTCDLIKANALLLFSNVKIVREQATPRIAWLLAKEEDALYKIPNLSRLKAADLADALIRVKTPNPFSTSAGHVFKNFGFLLNIFCDENSALNTRKKAGLQLVDELNSHDSCRQFSSIDGSRAIFNLLRSMISIDNCAADQLSDINSVLLPVSLEIFWKSIKYLFYNNSIFIWSTESACYTLLRIALLYHSDDYVIGLISSVLALLLFYNYFEVSSCKDDGPNWVVSSAVYQGFELPFNEVNLRVITGENVNKEINNEYFDSFLRYVWNDVKGTHSEIFTLKSNEIELLKIAERFSTFDKCLAELAKADSHKPLIQSLKILQLEILLMSEDTDANFDVNLFQSTFERFAVASPKSIADKSLFKSILQFFTFILNWYPSLSENLLKIMYKMILLRNGAIQYLMNVSNDQYSTDSSQEKLFSPFTKELLKLVSTILSKSSYSKTSSFDAEMTISLSVFVEFMHQHLNFTDSSQFYNLASLESVLHSLIHVTARSGFGNSISNETPMNICRRLTSLLIDIITAFHLSQENSHRSFMGRGVTSSATISLSHIAREMANLSFDGGWAKYWLFKYELQEETGSQMGLGWLISLWTHSDVEVRAASMSIMSTLTSSPSNFKIVMSQTQQLAGGLWGVALTFIVDHFEACIVREQAALILLNLIKNLSHGENPNTVLNGEVWYGPVVSDPEFQVPRVGLPALLILLQRINFIQEMTVILSNFYAYTYLTFKSFSAKHSNAQALKIKDDFSLLDTTTSIVFERTDQNIGDTLPNDFKLTSLSTCFLVKTICEILRHLVLLAPIEITIAMKTMKIFLQLERTFLISKATLQNESSTLEATHNFDISTLLKSVLDLLSLCCQADKSLSLHIVNNQLLGHLMEMLDSKLREKYNVNEMWKSVYNLLLIILSTIDSTDRCYFYNNVHKHIPIIIGNLRTVLNHQQYESTRKSALMWLVKFLSIFSDPDFRQLYDTSFRPVSFRDIFDSSETSLESDEPGYALSILLFQMLSRIEHNLPDSDKLEMASLTINTFSTLLAISKSAKNAAAESNLLTSVLLKLTNIFEHYDLSSIDWKVAKSVKNKELMDMVATNIICYFNLLKNFMHGNSVAKSSASESDLHSILLLFWSFVNTETRRLLPAYLSLIATYVSNCPSAGKTLCTPALSTLKKSNATILGELLKFCQRELMWVGRQSNTENLELAFVILGSLSFVPEGNSQIIKSKICQCYGEMSMAKTKSSFQFIPQWWLQLFIKMTFSREGREAVIGIPGIVDDFAQMLSSKECNCKNDVMTIIRNLCFMKTKKNRILNSSDLLTCITNFALSNADGDLRSLAASALWTLLANNRQAKVTLKCEGLIHRLEDVVKDLSVAENPAGRVLNDLESVLKILLGQIDQNVFETDEIAKTVH